MVKQSLWSSGIAAKLASIFLKDDGLLSLTGAQASLSTTPGMIGYGFAKSAVHHLCKSLAADKSGISKSCTVVSILPITLDTPMNRAAMPNADKSTWTPLSFVADLFLRWTSDKATRPQSGSLVQLHTASGSTQLVMFT